MYRIGRINDDLKKEDIAIKAYETTIVLGSNRKEYFAARAALQLGNIYEKQGKKQLAIAMYEKCLGMNDHEYKNSLDQKAKSGLARCKGE
jgi:tetratricopeptide (TPR) repeat protein